MEQLGSHFTDFYEIWYLSIFRKSVLKIQVSLQSDKNKGHFTWRPVYIFDHISLIYFRIKYVSDTEINGRGDPLRWPRDTPLSAKRWP